MRNLATIGVVLLVVLVGCNTKKLTTTKVSEDVLENKAAITQFYSKALTVNTETKPTAVLTPLLAEGYKSTGSVESKNAAQLMDQLEFFWKIIPDLKWEPQQITNEGDLYIVRSIASGTPNGDFMGLPTDGSKSFKIMTVDMHTMKDGKFVSTNHVEDWATAMGQLKNMDKPKKENAMDEKSKETLRIAMAYMDAMDKGDMEATAALMHNDMVWQNGGDKSLPWIGPWKGKKVILEEFIPAFGENFKTTKWETDDAFASGDTASFFGQMVGLLTKSNQETKEFTWALRVKVKDGKVILWNWFEDSFEVSQTYYKSKK